MATGAVVQGIGAIVGSTSSSPVPWVIGLLEILVGAALLMGLLTPIAGAAAAISNLTTAVSQLLISSAGIHDQAFSAIELLVMAIALVLLGPGAVSLDARLFGHREIIIPGNAKPPQP